MDTTLIRFECDQCGNVEITEHDGKMNHTCSACHAINTQDTDWLLTDGIGIEIKGPNE